MRNWIFFFFLGITMLAWSCSGKKGMIEELTGLEAELTAVYTPDGGIEAAGTYLEKVRAFADKFPKDTLSARYLFTAIGVARGLADFEKAVALAEETWNKYPDTQQAPEALFMEGFIYDSDMKDMENAQKYYQMFLDKYPDHPLSHNVKELMGLTEENPEELVKEFQQDSTQVEEAIQ